MVLKTLEKDRNRRYDTAKGLANDIERHLNDEPVVARPPSTAYQFQKFSRRHRTLLTAGSIVSLSLFIGIGVASWMAVVATDARRAAENAQSKQAELTTVAEDRAEEAQLSANRERIAREQNRKLLYASDMTAAHHELTAGNDNRVRDLLDRHTPTNGQSDLRDFEWYHLKWRNRQRWRTLNPIEEGATSSALYKGDSRIAIGHTNGLVGLYDTSSFAQLERFFVGRNAWGTPIAISPDGQVLAGLDGPDTVVLREIDTGSSHALPQADRVRGFAFSPDGALLGVLVNDEQILLWKLATKTVQAVLKIASPSTSSSSGDSSSRRLVFSHDGEKLAAGMPGGRVAVWTVADQQPVFSFVEHQPQSPAPVFSPDNRWLATRTDYEVTLVDFQQNAISAVPLTQTSETRFTSVAFAPDSRTLACGRLDGTIVLWDVETKLPRDELRGHRFNPPCLEFTSDGSTLLSASLDSTVRAWDLRERDQNDPLVVDDAAVVALQYSPDGKTIAVHETDQLILWSPPSTVKRSVSIRQMGEAGRLSFSNDWKVVFADGDGVIRLRDLSTMQDLATFQPAYEVRGFDQVVTVSEDAMLVAAFARDGTLQVWDRSTPDNTLTASCTFGWGFSSPIEFSPDAAFLAVGHSSGDVSLWDPDTLTPINTVRVFQSAVNGLAVSPDGRTIAASGNGKIAVWSCDTDLKPEVASWDAHAGHCTSLLFSINGRRLYSGGLQGYLKAWDVETHQQVASIRREYRVSALALSPDGRTLASGTWRTGRVPAAVQLLQAPGLPSRSSD